MRSFSPIQEPPANHAEIAPCFERLAAQTLTLQIAKVPLRLIKSRHPVAICCCRPSAVSHWYGRTSKPRKTAGSDGRRSVVLATDNPRRLYQQPPSCSEAQARNPS